ncbi:MAG: hypothetical protein ABSA02_05935 [Trebonia sp.]|jgi:hypothetical protein
MLSLEGMALLPWRVALHGATRQGRQRPAAPRVGRRLLLGLLGLLLLLCRLPSLWPEANAVLEFHGVRPLAAAVSSTAGAVLENIFREDPARESRGYPHQDPV